MAYALRNAIRQQELEQDRVSAGQSEDLAG